VRIFGGTGARRAGRTCWRLVSAATREPREAPPTHTWGGLTPFPDLVVFPSSATSLRAPVDGPVHNQGAPGDNWAHPVEGQNSSDQLAENPCQADEVSLEIIYVTGNGDSHRTSGTAGSAPPGRLGSSEPAKSDVRDARPPTTEARQRGRQLQRSAALGSQVAQREAGPVTGERGNA
jgi:hypothetical protein